MQNRHGRTQSCIHEGPGIPALELSGWSSYGRSTLHKICAYTLGPFAGKLRGSAPSTCDATRIPFYRLRTRSSHRTEGKKKGSSEGDVCSGIYSTCCVSEQVPAGVAGEIFR